MRAYIITNWSSYPNYVHESVLKYDREAFDICASSLFSCKLEPYNEGYSQDFDKLSFIIKTDEPATNFGIINDIGRWWTWKDIENDAIVVFTEDSLFKMDNWLKFNKVPYIDIVNGLNKEEKSIWHKFWEDYLEV